MECPQGFWCMQFRDWLNVLILIITALAIIIGPIAAVKITLNHEERRERNRRKYNTFHSLMKTRRVTLAPEHVTALNLSLIHISEPTRLGMISYAVFCLKKKQ